VLCKQSDDFGELRPKHGDFMTGYSMAFDELSHGTVGKA
jgi:hypothetical protein